MELVLTGKKIEFSPSCAEVADMIISVVHEMNKLLREVPTIQSWLTGSSNQFVPVTLNKGRSRNMKKYFLCAMSIIFLGS